MAKPTCEQIRQVQDFATNFRWDFQVLSFPNVGTYPASELINTLCTSTTLPKKTNEGMEAMIRGVTVHQPGISKWEPQITLNFLENTGNVVTSFIQQWREAISATNTESGNDKRDIEATILLTRLNSKDEPIWTYTLIGAWLEDYDLGELGSDASEFHRPSMILKFDYAKDSPV